MDVNFDKEIDAILRNSRRDGPVLVGDAAATRHLDADEVAAFAENALPEKTRSLYMTHLADCDRCRKILSGVVVTSMEAAPAAAPTSVITIAERDLPWYRKLFVFPNLAYVMGSFVLIFGGFLAFSVIQSSRMGESTMVSQTTESTATQDRPNFQAPLEFSGAANATANVPMPDANSNSNVSGGRLNSAPPGPSGPRAGESNFALDGIEADSRVQPPPATATRPDLKDVTGVADLAAKEKSEDKGAAGATPLQESAKNDAMLKQQNYSNAPNTQTGPMGNNENRYNRQLENNDRRRAAAAKRSGTRDEEETAGQKLVSGKTFERKQGVWYDTAYQGRPTINVRRSSEEFKKLDAGLRSIANSFSGTVVIVWGAKAYRIQ